MDWKEFRVHIHNEAIEAVSNIFNDAGANGVVIEDPSDLQKKHRDKFGEIYALNPANYPTSGVFVKAYFLNNDSINKKIETIKNKIEQLNKYGITTGTVQYQLKNVQEEDWENEWKKYFKRTKITDTFTIVPSWEDNQTVIAGEKNIYIDPGMAFGTGTHPTTILSLEGLEEVVRNGDTIIDVGSGSGILSIASQLLGAKKTYAFDLDEVAVSSTKLNAKLNHMEKNIIVKQNDLLKGVTTKANVIVSNILAEILLRLVDDASEILLEDGYFITSGIIESKRDEVKTALIDKGFTIIKEKSMEKWVSFIAQKCRK